MDCFGNYSSKQRCKECIYAESCCWYRDNPVGRDCSGLISFSDVVERICWEEICEMPKFFDDEEENKEPALQYSVQQLASLLSILNKMDKYTLKILARIITVENTSVATLAQWRGCSRQSIHEKMLIAARRYPFAACVFNLTTRRMPHTNTELYRIHRHNIKDKSDA